MKKTAILAALLTVVSASAFAQESAGTNITGKEYPKINPDRTVIFKVDAPTAESVAVNLGGRHEMTKNSDGQWEVTTPPIVPGFHYYQLIVDGTAMPDPGTVSFFGAGRWGSGIEIPSEDMDFWQVKDVPQGSIVEKYYWSKTTESMRHCYVYLPHEYDLNPTKKYPVLYLQHGNAENEYGWAVQGHTAQIMDNLIAEKKAVPMIVVMPNGVYFNNAAPGADINMFQPTMKNSRSDSTKEIEDSFPDIIKFIDSHYRTEKGRGKRAVAGLSMGGRQSCALSMAHPDTFGYVGMFSGVVIPDETTEAALSKYLGSSPELYWIGVGNKDGVKNNTDKMRAFCDEKGYRYEYYESEGGHTWRNWRVYLTIFAQKLFK